MSDLRICPICGGTGNFLVSVTEFCPCWQCAGSGYVTVENKQEEEEKDGD